jgi:hypothetical protein
MTPSLHEEHSVLVRWKTTLLSGDDPTWSCRAIDVIDPTQTHDFSTFFDEERVVLNFPYLLACTLGMGQPYQTKNLKVKGVLRKAEAWFRRDLVFLGFKHSYVDLMVAEVCQQEQSQRWCKARMLYNGALKTLMEFRDRHERCGEK